LPVKSVAGRVDNYPMAAGTTRNTGRLFAIQAVLTLVPVVLLGAVFTASYRGEANRRGIAVGRSQAELLAETAVEPMLTGHDLASGLRAGERAGLVRLVRTVDEGTLLRLRLRDREGHVVFSDDGSGFSPLADDEAAEAARGHSIAGLTRLNEDANDSGPLGAQTVEVYTRLDAGPDHHTVGVLEVYLPYAPIRADVTTGLQRLYRTIALGLAALWLVMFAVAVVVSRGLRRHARLNEFLAEHDALTGLPNRTQFHRRVGDAVDAAWRLGTECAIAIIDLDRFKEVNDTLGHQNGDALLVELAGRLERAASAGEVVARLGGDEFGIVLPAVTDAGATLARLRALIDHEVEINGLPVSLEASIGYVIAPVDGVDVDDLMQRADVAMYVAKTQRSGVVRYDPAHDHYDAANLGLIAELRHAIDEDQLVLHYQPKAATVDGRIEAVETLLRWQHPVHGLLYPDTFLPLAEPTDLIDRITDWVLRHALCELAALGGPASDLSVAVNVSARNLARSDFAEWVVDVLAEYHVPPQRLIIEITETALLTDPARAASVLAKLATAGVQVSLDDFGRGQTSLGYLSALPIHELKIDKSFVLDMADNAAHAAIVRSVVELGHNLALRVVGEGVEDEHVFGMLRDAGCDVAQGYFLARPMPVMLLRDWLEHAATLHAANEVAGAAGVAPEAAERLSA
jgi:diguanylate cyclase (GGDEF)-like protein